jgi:SAM-dependent methyltransferase
MDFSELMALATGHVEARIVQCAVELGVFDALEAAPLGADAVAHTLKLEPRATLLFLNALSALQLLTKNSEAFSLTDAARRYLLRSSGQYVGGMLRFEASLWSSWEKLARAIRLGAPVRSADMYQNDQNETSIFIEAMDSLVNARGDADVVASAIDWNNVGALLDVGSGPATYPIALCARFTNLRVTIFDLPGTLEITARYVRRADMGQRIELIAGDYRRDPIPGAYDVAFLSNIIHGEGEEGNVNLIAKLANVLRPGGRIIIKDHVLDNSRTHPPVGAVFSLLMLLTTEHGRCYSFGETKTWLEHAGFKHIRQLNLPPPLTSSLIIGEKP